jgi:arylsulfatase A-like enzyme
MATPPNVLVVMTDRQQAAAMSCAKNADLYTPHLDALAARGTRFASAYTLRQRVRACPVMLTGTCDAVQRAHTAYPRHHR